MQAVKKRWSTPAREKITDISKGISEILAGLAEPFMRYSTIYLALATSIKAINYAPVYDLTKGVVIAAPEFVLLGAFSIAETAIKDGQKKWGYTLFVICLALAGIMIATFVDIFIVSFSDTAIHILNFARCLVAVGFSVALGKLDDDQAGATDDQSQRHQAQPQRASATNTAPPVPAPPMTAPAPQSGASATTAPTGATNPAPVQPSASATTESQQNGASATTESQPQPEPESQAQPATKKPSAAASAKKRPEPAAEAPDTRSQEEKLEAAYQQLTREGTRVSGRALALLAHVHRSTANTWLETRTKAGATSKSQSHRPEPVQFSQVRATHESQRQHQETEPVPAFNGA